MSGTAGPARVLRLLLASPGPHSGQEMAAGLGCSRAAVGKAVAALRAQGLVIQARPRAGYQLISEPDLVLPARVEARLPEDSLGRPLIHFADTDSTNLQARLRAEQGAPHGACLVAEHQSAGRGRLQRRWQAPPGGCLLFSIILRPRLELGRVFSLTNLTALALCRAIEQLGGPSPAIKWPNDVFLEGRKLAGVLTEFAARAESVEYVVVGVGLNVNLSPAQLAQLPAPAASLMAASGQPWDRARLLAAILGQLSELYGQLDPVGPAAWREEYLARFMLKDRLVEVADGPRLLRGQALGVAANGGLLLRDQEGQVRTVLHGDVSVVSVDGVPRGAG